MNFMIKFSGNWLARVKTTKMKTDRDEHRWSLSVVT